MFLLKVCRKICRIINYWYYKFRLKQLGSKSYLYSPMSIDGSENIYIGAKVRVGYKTWLAAVPHTGAEDCRLILKDGVCIGHFNHIYATTKIIIEENVLTADRVYISDNLHGYEDIYTPIINQPIIQNGEVVIGEGSWLGENVCVLGVHIGKHCVIGANSVVNRAVPDYSVAVGSPARIIKRYCHETASWRKTNSQGNFVD